MAQQDSGLDHLLLRIFSGTLGLCSLCGALTNHNALCLNQSNILDVIYPCFTYTWVTIRCVSPENQILEWVVEIEVGRKNCWKTVGRNDDTRGLLGFQEARRILGRKENKSQVEKQCWEDSTVRSRYWICTVFDIKGLFKAVFAL